MSTVSSFQLGVKKEADELRRMADIAQREGDIEREERLRFQARSKSSLYWAMERKRKKGLGKVIQALEQATLFDPE